MAVGAPVAHRFEGVVCGTTKDVLSPNWIYFCVLTKDVLSPNWDYFCSPTKASFAAQLEKF